MTEPQQPAPEVSVAKAQGRPMLSWVGKRPLRRVTAYPAQRIERFAADGPAPGGEGAGGPDWPAAFERGGLLFHGGNKDVLAHLLANGFRGKVRLIYIAPPFDSGADYVRKVQLRGPKASVKIEGEDYALGEQVQYTGIWSNDNYLQFMYERLLLLREFLAKDAARCTCTATGTRRITCAAYCKRCSRPSASATRSSGSASPHAATRRPTTASTMRCSTARKAPTSCGTSCTARTATSTSKKSSPRSMPQGAGSSSTTSPARTRART
jgi:hypothetical protein